MRKQIYKFINGKRVSTLKEKNCDTCGVMFLPPNKDRKYCSRECYYKMKRIRKDRVVWTDEMRESLSKKYSGSGNPMYGKEGVWKDKKRPDMWGKKHWKYTGGYVNTDGYRMICFEGKKEIPEHKFIMENHLGRKLSSNEVVHHINQDKTDNRIENLQLMTRAEHMNHHREDILKGRS